MRSSGWIWLKLAALTPLAALYGSSGTGCTADALRAVAAGAEEFAQEIDEEDDDLGDLLADLVEDL